LSDILKFWGTKMIVKTLGLALIVALTFATEPALAHHVMGGKMPVTFTDGLLSGLGHPIIGLDHLAAVVAIGCLAATQKRGEWLIAGYVAAMTIGVAAHIGEATVNGAEFFVAASVIALGGILLLKTPPRLDIAVALFAFAGLVHGYALGESIAGAEAAPLYGYFVGLAAIQTAIAFAAMSGARALVVRAASYAGVIRLLGAVVAGFGLAILVQQIMLAA
jgi:urease accessory protein